MDLFHQTVSLKSVGNLNDFVRTHMLEPVDAGDRVRAIIAHFEDLTKAHEAVTRAREQLDALAPLVATADKYDAALARRAAEERQRDAVRLFFAELRIALLTAQIQAQQAMRERKQQHLSDAEKQRGDLTGTRDGLIADRARAGGDRVTELEREIVHARAQAEERRGRRAGFDDRIDLAGLAPVTDAAGFATLAVTLSGRSADLTGRKRSLGTDRDAIVGELGDLQRQSESTRTELASLAGRTSNLPASQFDVRAQLCADLGIDEAELPFAGELLDVAEEFADWRGAAERVLHGFALSMLVPQRHYPRVAAWVNEHRLTHRRGDGRVVGSRLVYERVSERRVRLQPSDARGALLLTHTIEIKQGPLRDYLADELVRRADYVCVDSVEEFRSEHRAVTRQGQVRSGERHEKDDRSRVDDPRSWVLGWVNERKVAALTEQLVQQQEQWNAAQARRDAIQGELDQVDARLGALNNLQVYTSWADLDHQEATARADAADAERERLVAGSSALAEIERRLAENEARLAEVGGQITTLSGDLRVLDDQVDQASRARTVDERFVAGQDPDVLERARAAYPDLEALLGASVPTRAEECSAAADQMTSDLQASVTRLDKEIGGHTQSMYQYMTEVRRRWPEATTEMDVSVAARADFRAFHDRVARDDLPQFEADFKRLLNTETIRELAAFHTWLKRQAEEIGGRVDRINEALGAIDYSPGHYITLVKEATVNQEVRDFRADLRRATTDVLGPDSEDADHYTEQRFADVQRIIERFRGREAHADSDRAWTRRVTDVRNWFSFAASERDRQTDTEREHYRDSDGKSGGQKEKLAYTILAASLAYQFGLEWGARRSRDFRFAVIDEAFGRGSDASTRYALDLFGKLGLQLLIVTPLQKVHIIEPYVKAIGFVDNPEGNYSRLQTLTIEEFRRERAGQQG